MIIQRRNAVLLLALALVISACSMEDIVTTRAERYVRQNYNDVHRIISVTIDTVTIGDNLDVSIRQALDRLSYASEKYVESGSELYYDEVQKYHAYINALDSLKTVLGDVSNEVAAYNCIVAYNYPHNLVWVQLDEYGNLRNITKDPGRLLVNPGRTVPGLYELSERYR